MTHPCRGNGLLEPVQVIESKCTHGGTGVLSYFPPSTSTHLFLSSTFCKARPGLESFRTQCKRQDQIFFPTVQKGIEKSRIEKESKRIEQSPTTTIQNDYYPRVELRRCLEFRFTFANTFTYHKDSSLEGQVGVQWSEDVSQCVTHTKTVVSRRWLLLTGVVSTYCTPYSVVSWRENYDHKQKLGTEKISTGCTEISQDRESLERIPLEVL